MSSELEGKKLAELRVVDLRMELEKRGLDKTGNKQALLERLQKALKVEEIDSEFHTFQTPKSKVDTSLNGTDTDTLVNDLSKAIEESDRTLESTDTTKTTDDDSTKLIIDESDLSDIKSDEKSDPSVDMSTTQNLLEDSGEPEEEEVNADATDTKNSTNPEESMPDSKDVPAEEEEKGELNSDDNAHNEGIQDKAESADLDVSANETTPNGQNEEKVVSPEEDHPTDSSGNAVEGKKGEDAKKATNDKKLEDKKDGKTSDTKDVNKAPTDKSAKPAPSSKLKERFTSDQNRNLWITNISQTTRATELKQALSEHGKVVGAKVVINARHPAACCYGYVKMETVADADNCIIKLNNTELNGQIIRIEKVRPDHLNPIRNKFDNKEKDRPAKVPVVAPSPGGKEGVDEKKDKKEEKGKETSKDKEEKKVDKVTGEKKGVDDKKPEIKRHVYRSKSREKHQVRSSSRGRTERSLSSKSGQRGREREREMLTFEKIKDERERERMRERERVIRERRREEAARQREIERHQRNESVRLEREREKLRRERERLERERADFMQFERERQKIEREKLELERIELERAKLRMQEEERRAVKRPAPNAYRERERSYEDRKRVASDRHFDDAPPPPRFDPATSLKPRDPSPPIKKFTTPGGKEYNKPRINFDKRESYPPKRDYDDRSHPPSLSRGGPQVPKYEGGSSYSNRDRGDIRDPRVRETATLTLANSSKYNPSDAKLSRYNERERERSPHFRSMRDDRERRPMPDGKPDVRNSRGDHRYAEQQKESIRYEQRSGANWSPQKVFSTVSTPTNKQWGKDGGWRTENPGSTERWNATNPPRGTTGLSSSAFSNNPGLSMGPSCPPPPGINNYVNDRFEYKGNMGGMRKY